MTPPYYCPECDEFSTRRTAHLMCRHLTLWAILATFMVVCGPAALLVAIVTGR